MIETALRAKQFTLPAVELRPAVHAILPVMCWNFDRLRRELQDGSYFPDRGFLLHPGSKIEHCGVEIKVAIATVRDTRR